MKNSELGLSNMGLEKQKQRTLIAPLTDSLGDLLQN